MNRVGGAINPYLSGGGLDTSIKGSNADQYARWLVEGHVSGTDSVSKQVVSTDRAIKNDIDYLTEIQERLNIKQATFQKACELAKKVEVAGVVKGSRMATKCATLMIVACKLTEANKEFKDIFKLCRVNKKEIQKFFKKIQHFVPRAGLLSTSSSKYVEQAAETLQLPAQIANWCRQAADNIQAAEVLTGKKPATIAGVALWMVIKRVPELKDKYMLPLELSNALEISEAAIKSAAKEVEPVENALLPANMK